MLGRGNAGGADAVETADCGTPWSMIEIEGAGASSGEMVAVSSNMVVGVSGVIFRLC